MLAAQVGSSGAMGSVVSHEGIVGLDYGRRFDNGAVWSILVIGLALLSDVPVSEAGTREDAYIAGYAASSLEHEFGLRNASIEVHDGILRVTTGSGPQVDRGKIQAALERIPGVVTVELREDAEVSEATDATNAPIPRETTRAGRTGVATAIDDHASKWMPHGLLFEPLHADTRWPRFSAAYRSFSEGLDVNNGFAGNFGETFAIYRNKAGSEGEWELGIQAGVFSLLDLGRQSIDLVNADYRVGLVSSYRRGSWSGFVRLLHQSSHLGDEFLLNNPQVERINLSYEEVDAKVSFDVATWMRVYGGGGALVRREPKIGRGTTQWGLELTSPGTLLDGRLRPVAYGDFQANERAHWAVSRSLMVGFQLENARLGDRRLQFLFEHYFGPSPDGQFYSRTVEWYGVGVHFFY